MKHKTKKMLTIFKDCLYEVNGRRQKGYKTERKVCDGVITVTANGKGTVMALRLIKSYK